MNEKSTFIDNSGNSMDYPPGILPPPPTDFTTGKYANLPPIHQTILSIEDDLASETDILEATTCIGSDEDIKRCEYSAQKRFNNKQRNDPLWIHLDQAIQMP